MSDFAAGKSPAVDPMPPAGFGSGTPNKKALRCALWLLKRQDRAALARCQEFYRQMQRDGHCTIGDSPPEPLTSTHAQLYWAAWAGALLGARRAGDTILEELVTKTIRLDTAACRACYRDGKVLAPGARAYIDGRVALTNSLRDKVIGWLLRGGGKPPRVGIGSYDVAIPLLVAAFAAGVKPASLLGEDYGALTDRYGFTVEPRGEGGYYASFTRLGNALEPVYGVGVVGGEVIVRAGREEAMGERGRAA